MLEKIHQKGLAMCLGCPNTASCEALEVQAGVLPLDLRREELAIKSAQKLWPKKTLNQLNSVSFLFKHQWRNYLQKRESYDSNG